MLILEYHLALHKYLRHLCEIVSLQVAVDTVQLSFHFSFTSESNLPIDSVYSLKVAACCGGIEHGQFQFLVWTNDEDLLMKCTFTLEKCIDLPVWAPGHIPLDFLLLYSIISRTGLSSVE